MTEFVEHDKINSENLQNESSYQCLLKAIMSDGYNCDPEHIEDLSCLGLDYKMDYKSKERGIFASYFIGLNRLPGSNEVIYIKPKRKDVNYLRMFLSCLNCQNKEVVNALSKIYYIDFESPAIKLDSSLFELTPFIVSHFVTLVQAIIKRGLKYNYSFEENNLNSKIKGKLLIGQQIKHNLTCNQPQRNYCRYQIYTSDCPENQLLKKALVFCKHYLTNVGIKELSDIEHTLQHCLSKFQNVSDDINVKKISQIKINPLFKEYAKAIKVGKIILRRFGYDINNANKMIDILVPPFTIDMSLLFEIYAYSKLIISDPQIEYQAKGYYGTIDFISKTNKVLIDAKYKYQYNDNSYEIDNIRQISGYARDKKLLKELGLTEKQCNDNEYVPKCLIVYPLDNGLKSKECLDINCKKKPIEQFTNFYKIGIALPTK